jgi:hypothetical protein
LESMNKKLKGNAKPVPALKEYGESEGIVPGIRTLGTGCR